MKSTILGAALSVLTVIGVLAAEHTWTGVISDKMCGANHKSMRAKMTDRDCTQTCTKGGAPYALVADGKVYQLTNHDGDLRTHAGHTAKVTGELKGDTIRVSTIVMPKDGTP
jgi:hypothetical protein